MTRERARACAVVTAHFAPKLSSLASITTTLGRAIPGDGRDMTLRGLKGKGSPYSIADRRVPELIPVLDSQHAGDVSHKLGGRLPLLSARPTVTIAPLRGLLSISLLGEQRDDGCEQFA